jgi:hypothetical protein
MGASKEEEKHAKTSSQAILSTPASQPAEDPYECEEVHF